MPKLQDPPPALPLFAQIERNLRQRILENKLAPGTKLPSEAELEEEFGVSRITVRQALSSLHAHGLIEKVNGKGSFVTRPTEGTQLGPLTGFYEHMRSHGHQAHGKTLSVRSVKASAGAAEALGLAEGEELTAITMVRFVDGSPLAFGVTYGQPALMSALLQEDLDTNDFMTLLESRLGYRLKNTHVETSAVPAGKTRALHLRIGATEPVLRIRFTPYDVSDRPLCYADMYFRGDGFSYKAVVKR